METTIIISLISPPIQPEVAPSTVNPHPEQKQRFADFCLDKNLLLFCQPTTQMRSAISRPTWFPPFFPTRNPNANNDNNLADILPHPKFPLAQSTQNPNGNNDNNLADFP